MDLRNRIGLYGSYFCGMAGIGFTLPYLPLYLGQEGLSDRGIGIVSTLAAIAGLAQFPVGLWSDRVGTRKPFLVVCLALIALSTVLLQWAHGPVWLGFLVILFAENGICRAIVESLSGAEATSLAAADELGAALGALRFWKPIGIVITALIGSRMAEAYGIGSILLPLALVQGIGVAAALLIHEPQDRKKCETTALSEPAPNSRGFRDKSLWLFIVAMILFHAGNAPGGVYLGLFLKRGLHAPDRVLAYAFVASMVTWMLVVRPAGLLADRWGRKPLLILCWVMMAIRLGIVAMARTPMEIVSNQVLDGFSNGLFAVLAAAWVTDRLADPRRAGEAQAIVGTSLVLGSAIGPAVSGLVVDALGYRLLFAALAGVGAFATLLVCFVPETLAKEGQTLPLEPRDPLAGLGDLSTPS